MNQLSFRKANKSDVELYFTWANDPLVREQSFNSNLVVWDEHIKWFLEKLNDVNCHFYLFKNLENQYVGQVRIQQMDDFNAVIGVSVDALHRGSGCGSSMLKLATIDFLNDKPNMVINAFIKEENLVSKFIFEKAGFNFKELMDYQNFKSYHYIKNADRKI